VTRIEQVISNVEGKEERKGRNKETKREREMQVNSEAETRSI
jgi:hypothetical protein